MPTTSNRVPLWPRAISLHGRRNDNGVAPNPQVAPESEITRATPARGTASLEDFETQSRLHTGATSTNGSSGPRHPTPSDDPDPS